MAKGTLEVQVTNKVIQQQPLENLIVKGEMNAADVVFVLDRYVNGVDLAASGMGYQMCGVNSNGQSAFDALTKGTHANPDKFTLTWKIGQQFTVADGALTIWLNVVKSIGSKVEFNWESTPARVFVKEGFIASEYVSVTEQLLIDLATYLSQAAAQAAAAERSAADASASEGNAKNSATAAAASAVVAQTAAANAKVSETNSKSSETAAKASKDAAGSSEANANQSALSAQNFMQQAQQIKDSTEMEYDVTDSRVGFKRKDESEYTYTGDLTGPRGPRGMGAFSFDIQNGYLYYVTDDGVGNPFEYDESTGNLYYRVV